MFDYCAMGWKNFKIGMLSPDLHADGRPKAHAVYLGATVLGLGCYSIGTFYDGEARNLIANL